MVYEFGEFQLDEERNELRRRGSPVDVEPTPLRLLFYLVRSRDRAVPKHELLDSIWPGATVSETALSTALKALRKVVGDDGRSQRVVRTERGHGFRFVADVVELQGVRTSAPVARGGDRYLAAILSADMVNYGRLVAGEGDGAAEILGKLHELAERIVAAHGGRLADFVGDNFLAVFSSTLGCAQAALEFQATVADLDASRSVGPPVAFRMGIHLGDVVERDGRFYGSGVIVAARLQGMAPRGGVSVSSSVRDQIARTMGVGFEDLGFKSLKNVPAPVHVFNVLETAAARDVATATGNFETPPLVPGPSLVVLPFDNLDGDPANAILARGVSSELTAALSQVPGFFVIAPGSAASYDTGPVDAVSIGRELGVRYLVHGSLVSRGDRVRLNARLVETATGLQRWSERYDRTLEALLDLQEDVTIGIVAQLEPALLAAEAARARRLPTTDLDAWTAYQLAASTYYFRGMQPARVEEVEALLDRAQASDARYAYAYSLRGNMLSVHVAYAWSDDPSRDTRRALEAGQWALELRPEDPTVLAHWGVIAGALESPEKGIEALRRSVELDPNNAHAWANLGWMLGRIGQGAEGREWIERAMRLSPRDPRFSAWHYLHATTYVGEEDWTAALQAAQRSLALFARSGPAWMVLAAACAALSRGDKAREAAAHLRGLESGLTEDRAAFVARHAITAIESIAERFVDQLRAAGAFA